MDARTAACLTAAIAAIIALSGCGSRPKVAQIPVKSETELAVENVKSEWLIKCEGVQGPAPQNNVGNLLEDYNRVVTALALCMARQHETVDYLEPVVKKERAK